MLSSQKVVEMLVHLLSGSTAGAIATGCAYPFANLRIRRVSEDLKKLEVKEDAEGNSGAKRKMLDSDILDYAIKLIKAEGVSSLYSGITSSILGSIVQNGMYFFSTKFWQYALEHLNFHIGNKVLHSMLINLLSAICTAIVTNPIWVLNARMTNKSHEERNMTNWGMIKKIYRDDGLKGFLKGIIPSLILTLNPVIQFTSYEVLKRSLADDNGKISNFNLVLISSLSKLLSIFSNYPLITIKTLCQANTKGSAEDILKLIITVYKIEGLLGFYKGLGPKVFGSLFNNTILMFIYERVQNFIRTLLALMILGDRKIIPIDY